jgi:parvulin-like peptidyl-prolyl isomerase
MSFRNRPTLDRKHRPRWQDELRTQQLVVAGFALAIAVAVGIFAATVWANFYDANLRQVALVDGTPIDRAQMTRQVDILRSELGATYIDLQSRLGGARDVIINQQLQTVQDTLNAVQSTASDSLVSSLVLQAHAADYGIAVTPAEIDAEVATRRTHPDLAKLSLLLVFPEKAADAPAGSDPTQEEWDAAEAKVQDLLDQVNGGADFATLAADNSDDSSKNQQGLLGWIEPDDPLFGDYFTAAEGTDPGAVAGPIKNDLGWYLLKVEERTAAGRNELLDNLLSSTGISDQQYRDYISNELLRRKARDYFSSQVVTRYQPQRQVAQIFINDDQGQPIPKQRIRHILIQPIPGEQDQSAATQEQWDAALAQAQELRTELEKPDADWNELAKQSGDTGSANRGGMLGWYDPATMANQFVPEFAAAVGDLRVGELSEPVKTDFGYHLIQITDTRTSAVAQADEIVQQARQDPATFGDLARDQSEDASSATKGGEQGWIGHYQVDAVRDEAIFSLTTIGQISDPVITSSGIYIYKLEDTSPARYMPEQQRNSIANSGYSRWLAELKDAAGIWIDPEFAPSAATA